MIDVLGTVRRSEMVESQRRDILPLLLLWTEYPVNILRSLCYICVMADYRPGIPRGLFTVRRSNDRRRSM